MGFCILARRSGARLTRMPGGAIDGDPFRLRQAGWF
jgi:hypothetical protein